MASFQTEPRPIAQRERAAGVGPRTARPLPGLRPQGDRCVDPAQRAGRLLVQIAVVALEMAVMKEVRTGSDHPRLQRAHTQGLPRGLGKDSPDSTEGEVSF